MISNVLFGYLCLVSVVKKAGSYSKKMYWLDHFTHQFVKLWEEERFSTGMQYPSSRVCDTTHSKLSFHTYTLIFVNFPSFSFISSSTIMYEQWKCIKMYENEKFKALGFEAFINVIFIHFHSLSYIFILFFYISANFRLRKFINSLFKEGNFQKLR